ncbi:hypothetical protein HHK36_022320 [Tetracentron sinense]|uniref:Uncharacterized protein n=1 Tax=Tetracentron sinense TaxID=13715 RepID=A0A834YRR0_TETSI|nr:hypothetical protein HHK36_022320 [Tetracentron sinense]
MSALLLQLGYLGLFRHCSMQISSIIISIAGRTTKSSSYQLEFVFNYIWEARDSKQHVWICIWLITGA